MLFAVLSVFSVFAAAAPSPVPSPVVVDDQRIRVRLTEAVPKVEVRGFDLRLISAGRVTKTDRTSEWELRCREGRVRAVRLKSKQAIDMPEPLLIESPAGFITYRGRPYRDSISVYSAGAFCEVINDVSLEKYLDGLVNAEFSAEWAEEAVAAQVVAARTYGLFQSRQAQKKLAHFDVDATVRDQVYDGSYKEDYRASRSVERTRGLVLTVGKGNGAEPIKAFYHSMCGGATEFPEHVWGAKMPGFKRSVTCKFCAEASRFNWTLDMQKGDFPALVKGGKLMDIRVTAHTKEGRVATVVTSWEQAGKLVEVPFSGAKFRELIGPAKLRSTWFQVTAVQQGWHFQGHGNGHGVGLCQWGAKVMGEKGRKMAEILKFYYPDAALKKLW